MYLTGANYVLKKMDTQIKAHPQSVLILRTFNNWKDISETMFWADVEEVRKVFPDVHQENKKLYFREKYYCLIVKVDFQVHLFQCEDLIL